MYRRLKNLLGVSLIILAIVLSQLPMGAVQADTTSQDETEVTTGADVEKDEQVDSETEDTVSDGEKTENDVDTEDEDSSDNEANGIAVVNSLDGDDSGVATIDSSSYYTVSFNYGFASLEVDTVMQTLDVQEGLIKIPDGKTWTIPTSDGDKELTPGETYEIDNKPYKFVGWCTDITCGTPWSLTKDAVISDITLYADWEYQESSEAVHTITYSASGAKLDGNSDKKDEYVQYGERIKGPGVTPVKADSIFVRWYDSVTNETVEIGDGLIPISDMVIMAEFKTSEYTVYFHANGGSFVNDGTTDEAVSTKTVTVKNGNKIAEDDYPTVDSASYEG